MKLTYACYSLLAILLASLILITGCAQQASTDTTEPKLPTDTKPEIKIEPIKQSVDKCPDGFCDDFELREGVCAEDCSNVEGWQEKEQLREAQPGQQTKTTQTEALEPVSVKAVNSTYKTISSKPTGWFKTGQDADIMLSGIDFNKAEPLLFNHPGNIASNGSNLLLADRLNNRILIWNRLPKNNTMPDLVLGQKDFYSNNPGTGLDQLNWPVSVAAAGGKVIVADTYNDRVLIWNSFPTKNGQPADLVLNDDKNNQKRNVGWPWAVWTDGEKLIVTSTATASALIWNSFPAENNQPADIYLNANEMFGTPRAIGSDGRHLIIGDHNSKVNGGRGNFFWKTFPTADNQPYDFFVDDVSTMSEEKKQKLMGDILWGATFTDDGKLIGIANMLFIWNLFPENENDGPDLKIGGIAGQTGYDFGGGQSGDGSGIVAADGKMYISLYNGNKIVVFNSFPASASQNPDFAIGADDIMENTFRTNYVASNPLTLTDGNSLFVASGFDPRLYVWKGIPDESGAKPDFAYGLDFAPNDGAIINNKLILASGDEIVIWEKLPLAGELPDTIIKGKIGNIEINGISGIAADEKYFYLADGKKIYVFEGIPDNESNLKFSFDAEYTNRLSTDGNYLVVTATLSGMGGSVRIYKVSELPNANPTVLGGGQGNIRLNLPQDAIVKDGHLFIGDTGFNRVLAWKKIEDAIAGKQADTILGAESLEETRPEIGKNKLFWPATLEFDSSYLWVGEFKFSNRVVRFSVR